MGARPDRGVLENLLGGEVMARFYGTLEGQARTQATRRGSTRSGLKATLKGWGGQIEVRLFARGDEDYFQVWHGSLSSGRTLLAEGPLGKGGKDNG